MKDTVYAVLAELCARKVSTLHEIAIARGMERAAVGAILPTLVDNGWADRLGDVWDGELGYEVVAIAATKEGYTAARLEAARRVPSLS